MEFKGVENLHRLSKNHVCQKVSTYDMLICTREIYIDFYLTLRLRSSDETLSEWLHFLKTYFGPLIITDCNLSITEKAYGETFRGKLLVHSLYVLDVS